jgi:hypothetical protein
MGKSPEDAAMTLSLYDASVPTYLQTLDAVSGFLDKALAHFHETGVDPQTIVETSLFPDMRPFRFQIRNVAFHSAGAMEAILSGALVIPGRGEDLDYAGLQALVRETADKLRAIPAEAVNARAGADLVFAVPDHDTRVFTSEGFLLSFSLPNFHFHATTAYDILRSASVPLGKRDYMGELRLKA